MAVQVRHAVEDQVSAARQEAQAAIRDFQVQDDSCRCPLLLTPGRGLLLLWLQMTV